MALAARTESMLESIASEVEQMGGKAWWQRFDISDPDAAPSFVESVNDHFGRIDVLVNNGHHKGDFLPRPDRRQLLVGHLRREHVRADAAYPGGFPFMRRMGSGSVVNVIRELPSTRTPDWAPIRHRNQGWPRLLAHSLSRWESITFASTASTSARWWGTTFIRGAPKWPKRKALRSMSGSTRSDANICSPADADAG